MSTTTVRRHVEDGIAADIATAAYTVYKRFGDWVSLAELRHLVSFWVTEHPQIVMEPPKRIRAILRRVAERYARRQKAKKSGYKVQDEYFYSLHVIGKMLPYALDPLATPPAVIADDLADINRHQAGKNEGYGSWEVALSDVRSGLRALTRRQRNLLVLSSVKGVSARWLALRLGITVESLVRELRAAMRVIQQHLGGARPIVHQP